ncbi:unnamed protein product, partial [Didymodactylos carnosus]
MRAQRELMASGWGGLDIVRR